MRAEAAPSPARGPAGAPPHPVRARPTGTPMNDLACTVEGSCCCSWGAAVGSRGRGGAEYPEFGCAKCPVHKTSLGETELCRRHSCRSVPAAPIRCERVIDHDSYSVVVSIDLGSVMVSLSATELTVTLTPGEAAALGFDLVEATEEPESCAYCLSFSVVQVEGRPVCPRHARAFDASSEVTR